MAGTDKSTVAPAGITPGPAGNRALDGRPDGHGEADPPRGAAAADGGLYRVLFDLHPMPMWVYEPGSLRFLAVNQAAIARYGYSRDEFLAMSLADIRPEEDVPRLRAIAAQHATGPLHLGRWRHRLKSGALIDVDVTWTPVEIAGRRQVLAVVRDVTEEIRTEAALREIEARFQSMVQNAPLALSIKDTKGRYLFCNPEAERAMGFTDKSYLGRTTRELLGAAVADPIEAQERHVLATGERSILEIDLSGGTRPDRTLLVKFPIRDAAGVIVALGGYGVDLSRERSAEQALKAREQLFDQVVNVMQEAIWIQEAGIVTFANPTAAQLFGAKSPEELIGKPVLSLLHPEQRPISEQRIRTLMAERKPLPIVEVRTLGLDNVERIAEIRGVPLVQGDRVLGVTSGRDVTERNRNLAALRKIEARFEALVQNSPIGINLKDTAGRYLYINAEGLRTMRLDSAAYVGKTARELLDPKVAALVEEADRRLLATGKPLVLEVDVPQPADYEYDSMLVVRVPVRDEHGAVVALGGFVIDISKQKQAERALHASEQRFGQIVDLVQDGIWIHDNGIITYANPAAARLFGAAAPQDLIGRSILDLLHPEDRERAEARTRLLIEEQKSQQVTEMRIRGLDGKERIAELQAMPLREGGKVLAVASGHDVTAHRRAEAQLQQAVKMEAVGQLTGGVAHDFNNLLTIIIGSLDLDMSKVPSQLQGPIDQAMRAADRGAALTHRLLAFSRQQTLRPGPVDCNRLIAGMDDLLRRALGEQVEVELHLAPDLKLALADAAQVESALLNLAINARDAMPAGGKLLIETANATLDADYVALNPEAAVGEYAMLAVSDTGVGMSPVVVAHAFEPFFTTKEVGKGTGLGLSMVYGFAKQSGGHVRIYSELGHGTTVRLYLPRLASAAVETETAAQPSAGEGGGERILVVEDDAKVRNLVLLQLEDLGYRVTEAANGREALAIIDGDADIDLLFTDVVMPGGMTGLQLAEAALKIRPRLRVLFTSGYAEGSMQHRGAGESALRLLTKPYRKQALARKIREALDE